MSDKRVRCGCIAVNRNVNTNKFNIYEVGSKRYLTNKRRENAKIIGKLSVNGRYDYLIDFYTKKLNVERRKQLPRKNIVHKYENEIRSLKKRQKKCCKNTKKCTFTKAELGCEICCCQIIRERELVTFSCESNCSTFDNTQSVS